MKGSLGKWYLSRPMEMSKLSFNFIRAERIHCGGDTNSQVIRMKPTVLAGGKGISNGWGRKDIMTISLASGPTTIMVARVCPTNPPLINSPQILNNQKLFHVPSPINV